MSVNKKTVPLGRCRLSYPHGVISRRQSCSAPLFRKPFSLLAPRRRQNITNFLLMRLYKKSGSCLKDNYPPGMGMIAHIADLLERTFLQYCFPFIRGKPRKHP